MGRNIAQRQSTARRLDRDKTRDLRIDAAGDHATRTALAWQALSKTVLSTWFGLFSDILAGSVVDLVGGPIRLTQRHF